jgi:ABC-2 type transport system permease protein
MPVFDQGYQHWSGKFLGPGFGWLAITRQGVRAQLKNRRTKYLIIMAWVPAIVLVLYLALWGMLEQKSDFLKPFAFLLQIFPPEILEGPKAYRTSVWTLAFNFFLWMEVGLSLLLTLIIGPDLISQDLRFNALPLYLSRPLNRRDYFLGKWGVIGTFIGAVTVLPVVIAYLVGVAFSLDLSVVRDTWHILVACVAFGIVVAAVSGLVMLALSSLSRNSRVVAAMWMGFWIMSWLVAGALITTSSRGANSPQEMNTYWKIVSFPGNLDALRKGMLNTDAAYAQLKASYLKAMQSVVKTARIAETARRGPIARIFGGRRRDQDAQSERGANDIEQLSKLPAPPFIEALRPPFPWSWAAAVLAALSVLSLCILSTRVRSLDRLR